MKTFCFPSLTTTIELRFVISTTLSARDSPLTPKTSTQHYASLSTLLAMPLAVPTSRREITPFQARTLGVPGRANRAATLGGEEAKVASLRRPGQAAAPSLLPEPGGGASVLQQMARRGGGFPRPSGGLAGLQAEGNQAAPQTGLHGAVP